jgi:hypothetical protein
LSENIRIKVPIFEEKEEISKDVWDSFMENTDEGVKAISFPATVSAMPSMNSIMHTQQTPVKNVTLAPNPVSSRPEVVRKDDDDDFLGIKWDNVNWKFWTWGEEEIYKEEPVPVARQDETHKIPKIQLLAHETPNFLTAAESKRQDLITPEDLAHPGPQPDLFIKNKIAEMAPDSPNQQTPNEMYLIQENRRNDMRSTWGIAARKDQRLNSSASNGISHGSRPRKSDVMIMKEKT